MNVIAFPTPYLRSNMYLIAESGHGIIIDPYEDDTYCAQIELEARKIDCIILTHEHFDHISGTNALRGRYKCPVLCSAACAKRILDPTRNFSRLFKAFVTMQTGETVDQALIPDQEYVTTAEEWFENEFELDWRGRKLYLRETPGHSPGSICILLDGKTLFSGDSLLPGNKATLRFPGGNKRQYESATLPWLRSLPADVKVYPGHYESFRIGDHPEIMK